MIAYRYFSVEDEAMASVCRSWRERFEAGRIAANDFALSMGATRAQYGFKGELIGLDIATPPDGWKRSGGRDRCFYPAKGPKGDSARSALAALPAMPDPWELSQMLGCRGVVTYNGKDVSGSSCLPGLYPVQLIWSDNDMALVVTDPEPMIADILAQHPHVEIEGHWNAPAGLVEITKAQWNLIVAQNAVARESKAA